MEDAQKLKHGKALCGKVFGRFVETFNSLVDFCRNLKGDGDVNESGKIVVDRSAKGHPVIRCKGCEGGTGSVPSSITGEFGETLASTAEKVSGDIEAEGMANSGLVMRSWIENEGENDERRCIGVGLRSQTEGDGTFGIHDISVEDGDSLGKIFSNGDIVIPKNDDEDDDDDDDGTSETARVVTGAEIVLDESSSVKKLVLKLQYANITGKFTYEDEETTEDTEICTVDNPTVVISSVYDETTHEFRQTRKKIKVLDWAEDIQNDAAKIVFTATPLTEEDI